MNARLAYAQKLRQPEWRLRRLEILERDEFTCQACGEAGGELEVHHRWYESGREPWDYPDEALETLCATCHADVTDGQREMRANLRRMIAQQGRRKSAFRPAPVPAPIEFDAGRAWRWISNLPDRRVHRPLMVFAGWLWSTGTHDMDLVMGIVEDRIRRNPDKPYAYYAPGGTARDCRRAQISAAIGQREHEAHKAAEREFLGVPERARVS